jgi:hypothetical protein
VSRSDGGGAAGAPRGGAGLAIAGEALGGIVILGVIAAAIGLTWVYLSSRPVGTPEVAQMPVDVGVEPVVTATPLGPAPASTVPAPQPTGTRPVAAPPPGPAVVVVAEPPVAAEVALPLAIPAESTPPAPPPPVPAEPTHTAAAEPAAQAAASPSSTYGTVTFTGNKVGPVYLFAGSKHWPAGKVPAGEYTIEASFNGATATAAGTVRVIAGETVNLQCNAMFEKCTVK